MPARHNGAADEFGLVVTAVVMEFSRQIGESRSTIVAGMSVQSRLNAFERSSSGQSSLMKTVKSESSVRPSMLTSWKIERGAAVGLRAATASRLFPSSLVEVTALL